MTERPVAENAQTDAATAPQSLVLRRSVQSRLLPLLVLLVFVVTLSAPLAIYLLKLNRLRQHTRSAGAEVAALIQREARDHPVLWQYNSLKLVEHARAYQGRVGIHRIVVTDRRGRPVNVTDPRRLKALQKSPLLWSAVPIRLGKERVGTVWVAASTRELRHRALRALLGFGTLGLVLGFLLYFIPIRAVSRAEARISSLLQQLERSQAALEQLNQTLEERIAERSAALDAAYQDLKDKERRLREMSGRALALQEAERRAIGRELHDGAGQALTAVRINLQLLEKRAAAGADIEPLSQQTLQLVDETLEELRRAVRSLGPAVVAEVGLAAAVQRHCDNFAERTGIQTRCTVSGNLDGLPTVAENACYRVLQEALHNVAKHAEAKTVSVHVEGTEHRLRFRVEDDGRGFEDKRPTADHGGQGLAGIRERVELLGGTLALHTNPDTGTDLQVEFPLPHAEHPSDAPGSETPSDPRE